MSTATVEKAGRRAFLEGRQHGVGGSDAAAIVGIDPNKFVWDVWDEKVLDVRPDLGDDRPDSDRVDERRALQDQRRREENRRQLSHANIG